MSRFQPNADHITTTDAVTPDLLAAWMDGAPRESDAFRSVHPDYAPTPLLEWPAMAEALGCARVFAKYETGRFGLDSFKPLGALYAVSRLDLSDVHTLACATAGNHGCGVALAARRAGLNARVFLMGTEDNPRAAVLRGLGAQVMCMDASFDVVYAHVLAEAADHGWLVIQDTSAEVDDPILRDIARGYGFATLEALETLHADGLSPTHVFAQTGAGAFACGISTALMQHHPEALPQLVLVEPERAACFGASFAAGAFTEVVADSRSNMRRLDVGTCAAQAWRMLSRTAAGAIAVSDAEAQAAAELWVETGPGAGHRAATPSGAAGVAGLMAACEDDAAREALGLDADSVVLVYVSERTD